MNKGENKIGCGKLLAYLFIAFFLGGLLVGMLNGVNEIISKIPWYGHLIISVSFVYIVINWNK
jgi:hypothetical protein